MSTLKDILSFADKRKKENPAKSTETKDPKSVEPTFDNPELLDPKIYDLSNLAKILNADKPVKPKVKDTTSDKGAGSDCGKHGTRTLKSVSKIGFKGKEVF